MKMIKRMKNIITSQVSAKLDKFEDPEKMIRYMMREIEETIIEAKSATTGKMATLSITTDEITETEHEVARWHQRAVLAVEKGKDDLARQAIAEKQRIEKHLTHLNEEKKGMENIISSMHAHVTSLETKRDEIRDKERMLIQRAYHAKEKKKVLQTLKGLDSSATIRRFNEFEEKIEHLEAQASVASFNSKEEEKEATFAALEKDELIENELALLKGKATT
ncbi:MAG: phage shock protein A [Spirochaetia bacterium]|nr:phage shock protein A [Spirochaetia bacterium]